MKIFFQFMRLKCLSHDLSFEDSKNSYLCLWLDLLHSVLYFFLVYWWQSSYFSAFLDAALSKTDKIISINTSAGMFILRDFNAHHQDWLTYYPETDSSGKHCYNLPISNNNTRMWTGNFPIRILDGDCHSPAFFIHFYLLTLVLVVQCLSFHREILIILLS